MTTREKTGSAAGIRHMLYICAYKARELLKYTVMSSVRLAVSVFPINGRKVFFSNFSGKKYGDSPKYISEALHEACPEAIIVWQQRKGYRLDVPAYVRTVRFRTVRWMYELMTSAVWVDSHLKPLYIRKRKGQFFLNTWHGGLGFKKIENDISDRVTDPLVLSEKQMAVRTAQMTDVFLSNSKWIEDIYRSAFHYSGKVFRTGFPKNDFLFRDLNPVRKQVRNSFELSDPYIILYAPTFRDCPDEKQFSIRPDAVIQTVEKTLGKGKKAVFMVRFHPLMTEWRNKFFTFSDQVIDATDYPDTQELIAAADCVISDYSSIVFDAMLLKKPVFLFVPDYESYRDERGFYLELEEYPFSYGKDTETVCQCISRFNGEIYEQAVRAFMERVQLTETGEATQQAVNLIIRELHLSEDRK